MRRWRRAFLKINIAKNSFELSSEMHENAPTITDLLSFTKQKKELASYSGSYALSPTKNDPFALEKGKYFG